MNAPERRIKGLGEVSLRVSDLAAMQQFYQEVIGLELLRKEDDYVFFRIGPGYGGHSQNFALFAAPDLDSSRSTLHHVALNIDLADYDIERQRLEGLGLAVEAVDHAWLRVRSLYFPDPEGNTVELVCYDTSLS